MTAFERLCEEHEVGEKMRQVLADVGISSVNCTVFMTRLIEQIKSLAAAAAEDHKTIDQDVLEDLIESAKSLQFKWTRVHTKLLNSLLVAIAAIDQVEQPTAKSPSTTNIDNTQLDGQTIEVATLEHAEISQRDETIGNSASPPTSEHADEFGNFIASTMSDGDDDNVPTNQSIIGSERMTGTCEELHAPADQTSENSETEITQTMHDQHDVVPSDASIGSVHHDDLHMPIQPPVDMCENIDITRSAESDSPHGGDDDDFGDFTTSANDDFAEFPPMNQAEGIVVNEPSFSNHDTTVMVSENNHDDDEFGDFVSPSQDDSFAEFQTATPSELSGSVNISLAQPSNPNIDEPMQYARESFQEQSEFAANFESHVEATKPYSSQHDIRDRLKQQVDTALPSLSTVLSSPTQTSTIVLLPQLLQQESCHRCARYICIMVMLTALGQWHTVLAVMACYLRVQWCVCHVVIHSLHMTLHGSGSHHYHKSSYRNHCIFIDIILNDIQQHQLHQLQQTNQMKVCSDVAVVVIMTQ